MQPSIAMREYQKQTDKCAHLGSLIPTEDVLCDQIYLLLEGT